MTGRCSLLTSPLRGAIAVIAVECEDGCVECLSRHFRPASGIDVDEIAVSRIVFGRWGRSEPFEELVLCRQSQTEWEVQCHGGEAASAKILGDLEQCGIERIDPARWRIRRMPVVESEIEAALMGSKTSRTAGWIGRQLDGRWPNRINDLCQMPKEVAVAAINDVLGWQEFGRRLVEGWRVVIAGRPNVGKSTLTNALMGDQRVIVAETAGTTRDAVVIETAFDGWPVQLADTAGLRRATDRIEAAGIERALAEVVRADAVILVVDCSEPLTDTDFELLSDHPQAIRVSNKCDRPSAWSCDEIGSLEVSAQQKQGIVELTRAIVRTIVPATPDASAIVPVTQRLADSLDRAKQLFAAGQSDEAKTALAGLTSAR